MDVHTSRKDQYAALTFSQLGSVAAAASLRVRIRMTDMMQVLRRLYVSFPYRRKKNRGAISAAPGECTHNNPRPNTTTRVYFCFLGNRNELITGSGMMKRAKSETRLTLAMMYQMVKLSRHFP